MRSPTRRSSRAGPPPARAGGRKASRRRGHQVPVRRQAQARWRGIVECEVLEADEPKLLRYSWADPGGGEVTEVAYRLEPRGDGTRFTYEHTGFTGVGGILMAALLGRVRARMPTLGLPAVLDDLN